MGLVYDLNGSGGGVSGVSNLISVGGVSFEHTAVKVLCAVPETNGYFTMLSGDVQYQVPVGKQLRIIAGMVQAGAIGASHGTIGYGDTATSVLAPTNYVQFGERMPKSERAFEIIEIPIYNIVIPAGKFPCYVAKSGAGHGLWGTFIAIEEAV